MSSGDARELSLISTGLAVDHHTLPIYADALTAARGLGDHEGAQMLQSLMDAERDRTRRLTVFHDWLSGRLEEDGKANRWISNEGTTWPGAEAVSSIAAIDLESALAPSAATRRE